uniref:Amino acid transporter n=1 Tax=Dicentrarchus labrax TaxID=13489 RepID=A0A8P4KQ41_DICLA
MLLNPNDLSELDSVEVTEPQGNQTYHKCNKSSDHVSCTQNGSNVMTFLKRNAFVVLTMVSVAIGIGLGFALRPINMSTRDIKYLTFPGELLMRILQMLVLPLLISSLITGMSSVDRKAYGKLGLRALSFYMVTTIIAAFTGIALAILIQPGKSSRTASVSSSGEAEAVQTVDSFLDLIRNMIPSNLIEACFRKYKTVYSRSVSTGSLGVINETETIPVPGTSDGINILGVLVFSVAFGLTLGSMGTEGKPLRDFFDCLNKAMMRLVSIVICSATLPVTLHCMEENDNMDTQVARFMLPIGATMNMDGAALYEAVAALFIAQVNNMEFNLGQIIILSLIVTAASTGAAGIPQAGMVSMVIVLASVGLPTEDISLLLIFDWILDRLRTTTNVLGDCIGVGVVQHLSRHELQIVDINLAHTGTCFRSSGKAELDESDVRGTEFRSELAAPAPAGINNPQYLKSRRN